MGEFEFIETIRRVFEDVGDGGITGIGDDCAVIPVGGGDAFVVTTDMLVEGVHFLIDATPAHELGAKSLAVNLSDVAAMGARPLASFLSIALPDGCRSGWAAEFMEGYRELSLRHGVKLAGGDTTASPGGVAINVTAIGRAPLDRLKYRSGAQVGDMVVVNGPLGESAAGLRDIFAGHTGTPLAAVHRRPVPQVQEGEWLGGRTEVRSMIDLSDGLASDLVHILRASEVAAEIELSAMPTPVAIEFAVAGGEDYKLLFTVAPDRYARMAEDYRERFGAALHPIGRIVAGTPRIVWMERGVAVEKDWRGYVHF